MNIELDAEIENAIREAVQSGRFKTTEAFFTVAATDLIARVQSEDEPSPTEAGEQLRSFRGKIDASVEEVLSSRHGGSEGTPADGWADFEKPLDLETLAREQNVEPIADPSSLKFDDWPEDDTVYQFLERATGLVNPAGPGES
ncbi:MAG: hypothetical protein ABI619_09790 [Betaproteobacteria bacterium]